VEIKDEDEESAWGEDDETEHIAQTLGL